MCLPFRLPSLPCKARTNAINSGKYNSGRCAGPPFKVGRALAVNDFMRQQPCSEGIFRYLELLSQQEHLPVNACVTALKAVTLFNFTHMRSMSWSEGLVQRFRRSRNTAIQEDSDRRRLPISPTVPAAGHGVDPNSSSIVSLNNILHTKGEPAPKSSGGYETRQKVHLLNVDGTK